MRASHNAEDAPLTQASTILVKDDYKLHYYFGYPEVSADGLVRLFNLKSDPEEMMDLYSSKKGIAAELLNELKGQLQKVNEPYL